MDRTRGSLPGRSRRASAPLSVLNISVRADTGGDGIRTKWAFDRLTDWAYYATCRVQKFGYPQDTPYGTARRRWEKADVVHVRQMFTAQRHLNAPDKPLVIQHHGTFFREHHRALIREQRTRGAIGLAATLDLWAMYPDDLEWLPAPYNLDWLASFRKPSSVLTVAHAPTNRGTKGTDRFLEAMARIPNVRVLLIENADWRDCLRLKGGADIYYDQLALGYGNNAVEAWGMGIPVIAGAAPETLAEYRRRFGTLPFYEATPDTLEYALQDLASSQVKRDHWGRIGREHAERFHADEVVVPMLQDIYRAAHAG